ncbi:uncharacterized protein LOC62_06G008543 [Vanrija pseudolonga]|uniref:Uncharacterized protein n=1 Tax=Vanrija pseudolonga TaxID=143232 RepID=A0AAF0YDZ6_9TREE|nr:hypothetical protein LOC62_06G008543 [Vanrija pseudolonga]
MPISWPDADAPAGARAALSAADISPDITSSSLPSYPSSDASDYSDDQAALIQEEWDESMRQIEGVISLLILPFFGKWYGRKVAFWAYDRYQTVGGFTRQFFGL